MGLIIDKLIGNVDEMQNEQYNDVDFASVEFSAGDADTVMIHTATVSSKQKLLRIEEVLRSGDVVIAELETLKGDLTRDNVAEFLSDAAEEVDGDIVWKSQNELVLTPRGIAVSRESLE